MSRARLLTASAAVLVWAGAAAADPVTSYQLIAGVTGGYSDNPYLETDGHSAATLGINLQPELRIATATATTDATGTINYTKYLNNYTDAHNIGLTLSHINHFSSLLTGNAAITYSDATSSLLQPLDSNIDIISSKQRVKSISGSGGLDYQLNETNDVSGSANYSRSTYPGQLQQLSDFHSYGAQLAYNHTFSARMTGGLSLSGQRTLSSFYPDSTVYSTRLTGKYQVNAHWTFDGSVGVNFEDQEIGGRHNRSRDISFDGNLCGAYPRLKICVNASRGTSPSGYGGLRTRTQLGASGTYTITEHSSLNGNVSYTKDSSQDPAGAFGVPNLSLFEADIGYSRDLTERLAFTTSATYQQRRYQLAGSGHGFTVNAGLRITLGHLVS